MVLPGRRLQRNTWSDSGTFLRQSARSSSVGATRTLFLRPLIPGSLFFFASPAEEYSGRSLPEIFPYSALSGSTVDQFTEAFGLLHAGRT